MTQPSGKFLSCDWGTSSLRLRLVAGGQVLREQRSDLGVRAIYQEALESGGGNGSRKADLFAATLRGMLEAWRDCEGRIPLIISGMASSSIGWQELPYTSLPFKLDGSSLHCARLEWNSPTWVGPTWLVSGVASAREMMRGEETEAVGLHSLGGAGERAVLVLPGTHSKHLLIAEGAVTDFWTCMTGELFDILSRHSVLRATVDSAALGDGTRDHWAAFDDGVKEARDFGVGRTLFQARTRGVLGKRSNGENAWFLSGVLIGGELADLFRATGSLPVWIAGGRQVQPFYLRAVEVLATENAWRGVPAAQVEAAVPRGHAVLLARLTGQEVQ